MKIGDFIKRVEALAAVTSSEEVKNRVSFVAVSRLAGLHKTRIFTEGEATDGSPIGTYSKKAFYAPLKRGPLPQLSPLGKNGKSTFKNGKKKKTRYFKNGYFQYRPAVKRFNDKVDLDLTSTTRGSLAIGRRRGKITYGFTNKKAADIMNGNEKRFTKEITKPSEAEIKAAGDAALGEWLQILNEIYVK